MPVGAQIVTIGAESKCQVGFCTPIEIAPTSVWGEEGGVMSLKQLTRYVSTLGGAGVLIVSLGSPGHAYRRSCD